VDGEDPDLVLLRATDPPEGLTPLQIARDVAYEYGEARALTRLPTRETDRAIAGVVDEHIDEKRRRAFTQPDKTRYWFEEGSSGSPIFVRNGQQLAGIVAESLVRSTGVFHVARPWTAWPFERGRIKRAAVAAAALIRPSLRCSA
jgi:hypothetical protein